jgi:hypothetical protein
VRSEDYGEVVREVYLESTVPGFSVTMKRSPRPGSVVTMVRKKPAIFKSVAISCPSSLDFSIDVKKGVTVELM